MNNPSLFFVFPSTAYIHLFYVRVDHNVSAVIPLPPPTPPDMSPHILSVLTSITQPPRSALLTPVLIPCVCQIIRPRPVWFSHVSSSLFSPPPPPPHTLAGMQYGNKCSVSFYITTLSILPPCTSSSYLHVNFPLLLMSPLLHMSVSEICEANLHFHWFSGCCNDLLRIGSVFFFFLIYSLKWEFCAAVCPDSSTLWICLRGLIESKRDLKLSGRCSSVVFRSPKVEVPNLSRACSQQVCKVRQLWLEDQRISSRRPRT